MITLFGVTLPHISKYRLRTKIRGLRANSKTTLYWFYSEFLLRANRNPAYKSVLQNATITVIDGKGMHWAMWSQMHNHALPQWYARHITPLPQILHFVLFPIAFFVHLLTNCWSVFFTLMTKYDYSKVTQNEVILGRRFTYDLLEIAQDNQWKTMILGGSKESDKVTKELINKLYPQLELVLWTRKPTSLLMRDAYTEDKERRHPNRNTILDRFFRTFWSDKPVLSKYNLFHYFPDLLEAKKYIEKEKPDVILTCLGGASGKQEFFIDNLKSDPRINFTLATGLGAAIDHLGAGAQQTEAPLWMQQLGLEWLHRFLFQPYRRMRIIDSIWTLIWWLTVEQFMRLCSTIRPTVTNIITNSDNQFLIVRRRNVLPGDVNWSFVQGEVGKNEHPELAGLREIAEEVELYENLKVMQPITKGEKELYTISFLRFLAFGASISYAGNFYNLVKYNGTKKPQVNWENSDYKWVSKNDLPFYLSEDKLAALKQIPLE